MLEKLAGIHYWITVIGLILGNIMIAAPFVILTVVKKIMDGIDVLTSKIHQRKKGAKNDTSKEV